MWYTFYCPFIMIIIASRSKLHQARDKFKWYRSLLSGNETTTEFYTNDVAEFQLTEVKLTPTWSHEKLPGAALRFNMHSLHSCRYDTQLGDSACSTCLVVRVSSRWSCLLLQCFTDCLRCWWERAGESSLPAEQQIQYSEGVSFMKLCLILFPAVLHN